MNRCGRHCGRLRLSLCGVEVEEKPQVACSGGHAVIRGTLWSLLQNEKGEATGSIRRLRAEGTLPLLLSFPLPPPTLFPYPPSPSGRVSKW